MKRSFQKRCAALLALAAAVGLLAAGCGEGTQTGEETQTGSVSQQSHLIQWITIDTKDMVQPTVSTSGVLLHMSFRTDTDLGKVYYDLKEIELVSSNPEVAEADMKIVSFLRKSYVSTSDPDEKNAYSISGAKVTFKSRGTAEIYAKTKDGKVVSNKITVTNGKPDPNQNYITQLIVNAGKEQYWLDSDENQGEVAVAYKSLYSEDMSKVVWVVGDPSVASVQYGNEKNKYEWTIIPKSTGETEIYAKTPDGSVVSNKVKLSIGNRYNKQEAVRNDIEEMVFKKLKYNAVQRDKLEKLRPYYLFPNIWYHRGQLKAIYSSYTDLSTVESSSIEFSGQDATIRGSAKTFNDNAIAVNLNFVIRLHYSDDFTQYTVVSEAYDMPELIRANIG